MIKTDDLTKIYGKTVAVDGIDLTIKKGELFGLLGPNGSGKTTMIKMLTGQLIPTSGFATVLGHDVIKSPLAIRRDVGIIPEQETPPSFLTAQEYLAFVSSIRKIDGSTSKKWFKELEFEDKKDVLCKDLSRGQRQKLMVAQAFLHEPRLAFIDEPLINLDPIMQHKIKRFLTDYVKKGNTIFLSTHVLEIAKEICTRIGIIHNGKLIYVGKPKKDLEKIFLKQVAADA